MADEVLEQPTREILKELGCQKWMSKIAERLMVVLDCMKNKTDIKQEEDWQVIEMLHADWFFGEHIIYETINIPDLSKSVSQPSLFDDKTSDTSENFDDQRDKILDGTKIDTPCEKPKNKQK